MIRRAPAAALLAALLATACSEPPPPPPPAKKPAPVPTAQVVPPKVAAALFVNRVWAVQDGDADAPGTLYAFLGDGTLVVSAPGALPRTARWEYIDRALRIEEGGLGQGADVVSLTATGFVLRRYPPGGPVDVTLVPAPQPALY